MNYLNDEYLNERSKNNFKLDELKSALQKYIRRGEYEKAYFVVNEFLSFKQCEKRGKIILSNFIHRLLIITMEDISNPLIIKDIDNLFDEKKYHEIVYLLCKSKKSRICDHYKEICRYKNKDIKDFKLDIDLLKQQFKEKNPLLVNTLFYIFENNIKIKTGRKTKPIYFIFNELKLNNYDISIYEKWYKQLENTREHFLCFLMPLLDYLKIIKSELYDYVDLTEYKYNSAILSSFKKINDTKYEFDEYVYDKHVSNPKNNSIIYFINESSKVSNEINDIHYNEIKDKYEITIKKRYNIS